MAFNEKYQGGESAMHVVPEGEIPRDRWDCIYDLGISRERELGEKPSLRRKIFELLMASEQRPER